MMVCVDARSRPKLRVFTEFNHLYGIYAVELCPWGGARGRAALQPKCVRIRCGPTNCESSNHTGVTHPCHGGGAQKCAAFTDKSDPGGVLRLYESSNHTGSHIGVTGAEPSVNGYPPTAFVVPLGDTHCWTDATTTMLLVGGIDVPHARASRFSSRLDSPQWPAESPFTEADLRPMDRTSDRLFYLLPRFVQHADEPARLALRRYYESLLATQPEDAPVLDLCASWTSHLPDGLSPTRRVAAVGMNELELRANPSATEWRVQDLNAEPSLPYEDDSFAFCTMALSVDYMTRPVELLREVCGCLEPHTHRLSDGCSERYDTGRAQSYDMPCHYAS